MSAAGVKETRSELREGPSLRLRTRISWHGPSRA